MGNTAMVTQNPSKRGFLRPSVSLFLVFFDGGDPFGARTQDPNIKSVVLYQLS